LPSTHPLDAVRHLLSYPASEGSEGQPVHQDGTFNPAEAIDVDGSGKPDALFLLYGTTTQVAVAFGR
jgi:hypothetical protein